MQFYVWGPMELGLNIRSYRPGDAEAILRGFNDVFRAASGESLAPRDLETWEWLYEHNPAGMRVHVAATEDGVIGAHYAALPNRAVTPVGDTVFGQIVDSYTHPDFRKGLKHPGWFIRTAIPALDIWENQLGDGMYYGYPVRIAQRMGKRYLDYEVLRIINYLVLDFAGVSKWGAPPDVEIQPVDWGRDQAALDVLAAGLADDKRCLIDRGADYLDWRYRKCPGDLYLMFGAWRGGELVGCMVLRPCHDALLLHACSIADWMVPGEDRDVADALLAAAVKCGQSRGCEGVLAVFPDPQWEYAHLQQRGFRVESSSDTAERRLTYRIPHPRLTVEMLDQLWFYTLGDSDLV